MDNGEDIRLKLWVGNQINGITRDETARYLRACGWKPPKGIKLDIQKCTLTGPYSEVMRAYRALAKVVAKVSHGKPAHDKGLGPPQLLGNTGSGSPRSYALAALSRFQAPGYHRCSAFRQILRLQPIPRPKRKRVARAGKAR